MRECLYDNEMSLKRNRRWEIVIYERINRIIILNMILSFHRSVNTFRMILKDVSFTFHILETLEWENFKGES